ncbi:HD domain-containing protein, partial [Pseudomonas protegens]|nr:HD domain-containing protein [Pseudomonas protegens]
MTSVYTNLLSNSRFRPSEVTDRHILLEAESDRGRLLFCPAFRRLQQKAQVFSMESNASVRSRLTHSLEVAQVGRYIADQISIKLIEKELASREECAALTTFVETACLMHDIGNPPFGHFGEFAISEWFRNNGRLAIKRALK